VDRLLDAGGRPVSIADRAVLAVSGIGNPAAFVETLRQAGARINSQACFPDHHAYTPADIHRIIAEARESGALAVTTSKDWVKIQPLWPPGAAGQIAVLELRLEFAEEHEVALLNSILPALTRSSS
jgi:tetraacyldisaccharide 4'-kinase